MSLRTIDKKAPKPGSTEEPKKVYGDRVSVRGLPREVTSEEVTKFFSSAGTITKCRVNRSVTIIVFSSPEAATKALEFHEKPFTAGAEKPLRVNLTTRRGRKVVKKDTKKATPATTTTKATKATPAKKEAGAAKTTKGKSRRVIVTLEPTGASAENVQKHFATAGEIYSFKANEDGTFTVIYTTSEAADAAIAKSGSKLGNAVLAVKAGTSRRRNDRNRKRKGKGKKTTEGGEKPTTTASPKKETGAAKKRVAESTPDLTNYVYVGGLTEASDEAAVRKLLSSFGKISDVTLTSRTYKDGNKKTFATVHFETAAAAEKAIANGASKASGLVVEKAVRVPKKAN